MSNLPPPFSHNHRNHRNHRNPKMKGRYFLDKLDNIYEDQGKPVHSTDSFTLWNFYHNLCYGKLFPGEINDIVPGDPPDWNVITFNGRVIMKKIKGKYTEAD